MHQSKELSFGEKLSYYYRRYEFATAVCLLEPWEKRIVNTAIFGTFAVIVFSTGYYLPQYIYTYFSST